MDNANPFDQLVDQVPETSDNPFDALVSSPAEEKPAAPANPFESLVDEADQDAVSTTEQSIRENAKKDVDPKRMAEAIRIGKEQGVPAEVVYDNIGTFKADPKAAISSMTHAAPVTSKLLADPIKGPVLFPDHQPLTDAEQAVQELNALADFTKKNPPAPAPSEPGWGYLTPEESRREQQRLLNAYATDQVNLAKAKKAAEAAQANRLTEEKRQSEVDISQERALGITNYVQPPMDPFGMGDPENVGAFKKSMDYNAANIETLMKVEPIMTRLRDQVGRTVQTLTSMTVGAGAGATDIINAIRTLLPGEVPGGSVQVPGTNASPIEILNNPFANETSKFSSVGSYAPQGGWSEDEPPPALADPQERQKLNNVFAKMEKWIVDNVPTDRARDDEFVSKLNAGITSTGVFLAGGWAARALGLSSEAATAILGTLSGAHSGQQDAAQRGATPDQEAIQTLLSGMMGLTEIVPIEKYLDWAEEAGGPFWQRAFSRMIAGGRTEGIQEVMQNAPTDVFAKLTYDPERNVFANAWDNFLVAATTGGLFGAMTAVSNPNPEKTKEQLDRYRKAITGTQASQIAPELLEEHLVEMKKAGKAPEFVTAKVEEVEALFQEMDPEVLKNVFPDAEAAIQEARDSNAEVSIPTEKLAHLAQLQGFGRFVDHVRLDPDAPTVAEQKKLKEDVDRLLSEMDTSSTTEAPGTESSPVFMTIRDQLVKAGHSADTAAPMARIYESFFTTQAERIGMDPVELLRRYGLEITNSEITAEQMAPQLEQLRKEWADPTRPETPAGAVASQSSPASTIPDTTSLRSQLSAAGITPQALAGMTNEQVTQTLAERTLAQDKVTSTPEFRNWFGDSKVVDENGSPLVVYHGTASDFSAFRQDKAGKSIDSGFLGSGSYFSSKADTAGYYAGVADRGQGGQNIMPVYVSLKNPFMWGPKTQGVRALVMRGEPLPAVIHDKVIKRTGFKFNPNAEPDPLDERMLSEAVTAVLKEMGYDGVIASSGNDPVAEVVAFNPTQIKSAVGNSGAFDPNDPNILYQADKQDLQREVTEITDQVKAAGGRDIRTDQVDALVDDDRIPVITLADLIGKIIFPTIADRTAAGALYRGIDGSQLNLAIPLLGGPLFPFRESNMANNVVWGNRGEGVTTSKGKKVAAGAKYMAVLMGDADMHQSNTTVANTFFATLEAYARDGRITPENSTKLVELVKNSPGEGEPIRKALKAFPGVTDAKALDTYLHGISFDARKRLLAILGTKAAQDLGAPSMTKILRATREPSMATHRWGDAVLIVEIDENQPFVKLGEQGTTKHPDFPLGIRGKVLGKLATPINYELLWQDYLKDKNAKGLVERSNRVSEMLAKAAAAEIDADTQKFLKDAEAAAKRDPNNRRAFELARPELAITQELVDRIGEIRPGNIEGFRQARLASDMVVRNWRRSDKAKNKGGVSPQAFLDAVANSDYSATLTQYSLADVKAGIKDGSWLISQLGDGEIYYALKRGNPGYAEDYGFTHPSITDNEVTLVSVVNNEQGARGIAGPAILLDALENGATVFDCFGVQTPKFPAGFLPTLYGAFGFEKVGEVPFDPQYYDKNKLADVEAAWSKDGWNKDRDGYPPLVIMKWSGTDADRAGILERYLGSGIEGLLAGGALPNVDAFAQNARDASGTPVSNGDGADAGGAARDQGARRGASLASRARDVVAAIAGLNKAELQNLGLTPKDQAQIIKALAQGTTQTKAPETGPSSSQDTTTLNQGGAAPTNARGFITFNQARDKFRITLTGNANLSTFLHESGHFFLEVLQDLVEKGLATDQQRADLEILRSWMGLKPGEKIGVKQHEQFARGTEAYFMEGKAPSNELVGAFQRFKSWLTFVYRSLAGLNVKLTDEVRGVMDRLLASDQAIAEARAQVGWRGAPMSQQETGLTDAEYKAYTEAWIKANDAQSHDADARVLLEAARELKKVWRDEKIAMTNQMQEELSKTRGYRAWQLLTNGEGLADVLPNAADLKITPDSIPQEWKRDAQGMTSPPYEAGLPLDYVAELLGFDSGEQMLALIAGAKAAQKAIPAKVRAAMEAKHGRMDANALATEAAKAVHNKPTMDVLLTEFRAMASKAGQNVPKQIGAILAAQARAKVAELTQRQLQPTKWRRAELKAAHEAGQAAGRGDAMGAFLAKRRQMVAASMVKATLDAQDRVEKIRDYLSTFQTDRRRAQLGKAGEMYLDGVDQILENLELKDVPLKLLKKRPLLQDIVQKAIEEDEPINIPAEILGMGKRNYSQLTLGELEAVHDAVKNLWTLAKLKNQLKSRQGKIQLDKAMEQIAATADAFLGEKRQPDTLNPTAIDKAIGKLRWVRAKLVKMEFLFSWLDGRPDGGLAHQLIYQPIADARAAEYKLMEDMTRKILDPIRNMPREQRQRWDTKRTFMGQTMKGANIIAVALNMGNEQNKTKLLQGYGWNENLVMAELNQFMTKADWDMVQQIWDAIDSLWPHIERTAKNATGLAPDRVVPSPVITPHGQYSGGYYPIVYDPFRTQKVAERQEAKASANGLFANNFLRPTLDNGFTKKRTGYVAPIYLSLDVLSQHLAETIHYVTHYEAVKQADKIRSHPVFQELVTRNMGREFWSELRPWLQDIANNVTQRRYPEFGDAAMRYFRVGTTVAAMGFNIGTALKQTFGIATSLVAVSPRYWASGVYKAWMSPNIAKNWRFALKESQELRPLIHDFDRDVKQINDTFAMSLGKQLHASILQKAFLHIGAMQLTVNVATWHGAYEQALARGDSHEMAVIHADSVVRKTQSSGSIKDLADVQRSGEMTKMFTMFYSYFSVVYNQLEDVAKNTNSVKDIPRAASKIVMLSIVPTLLNMGYEAGKAALFGGGDDGEDEDQQSFITSLMLESVNQLVGAVPLLRNLISFGDHGGKVNFPIISKFGQMQNTGISIKNWISEGEAPSRKQVRTMVDVFSMLTKTPIAPMYKLIDDAIGVNLEE